MQAVYLGSDPRESEESETSKGEEPIRDMLTCGLSVWATGADLYRGLPERKMECISGSYPSP